MGTKIIPSNVQSLRLVEMGDDKSLDIKKLFRRAKSAKLNDVLIIGRDNNGEMWAECSLNAGQSLWLLEKLRERILSGNPWNFV